MGTPERDVIGVCGDERILRNRHNRVVKPIGQRGHEFIGRGKRVDEMLLGSHRRANQLPGFDIRSAPLRGLAVHLALQ